MSIIESIKKMIVKRSIKASKKIRSRKEINLEKARRLMNATTGHEKQVHTDRYQKLLERYS